MLSSDALDDLLHDKALTVGDKLLVILAVDADRPKKTVEIRNLGKAAGWREIEKRNLSRDLPRYCNGLAIKKPEGWKLNKQGRDRVCVVAPDAVKGTVNKVSIDLRKHFANISNPDVQGFLKEAIECLEHRLFRAAVVLAWVGGVAVLHDHIVANHLAAFNAAAKARYEKAGGRRTIKTMTTAENIGEQLKETELLQVLHDMSVIDKSVKTKLGHALDLRNSCGHPTSLKIGEHTVAAHIETLILNVFAKFT